MGVRFTYSVYVDRLDDLSFLCVKFHCFLPGLCIAFTLVEIECVYGPEDCVTSFVFVQEIYLLKCDIEWDNFYIFVVVW